MPLSPETVRSVVFDKAPFGKRGYHEGQVDDFLDLVEATLAGKAELTAAEVREVVFDPAPLVKRGYHEEQVDAFLDLVVAEFDQRETADEHTDELEPVGAQERTDTTLPPLPAPAPVPPGPQPRHDPTDDRVTDAEMVFLPLPPAPPGVRGYRPGDVDRLARALRHAALSYDGRPTAAEIAGMRMNLTFFAGQGYHPAAVDALIDIWAKELRHRES